MPQAFDKCKERPAHIEQILNGPDRYNPETTTTFQEYVNQQCEEKFFDVYACLTLLKQNNSNIRHYVRLPHSLLRLKLSIH
jgi:translation initiation factor 3 subunit K